MAERITISPEREESPEKSENLRNEHSERLREQLERNADRSPENSADNARHEIEKITAEKQENERTAADKTPEVVKKRVPTTSARKASFDKEMANITPSMSPVGRVFSKLIHARSVEKASEAVGSTVARPNAVLAGSLTAFILTAGIYFWARYANYPLSGFETIGAFIIGWLIGMIFDFTRIMLTGKSQ